MQTLHSSTAAALHAFGWLSDSNLTALDDMLLQRSAIAERWTEIVTMLRAAASSRQSSEVRALDVTRSARHVAAHTCPSGPRPLIYMYPTGAGTPPWDFAYNERLNVLVESLTRSQHLTSRGECADVYIVRARRASSSRARIAHPACAYAAFADTRSPYAWDR